MKKILWLPSWYPTKIDPFRGDFIQRHAQAVSLYNTIHVIFVEKKGKNISAGLNYEKRVTGNLSEEIIYNSSSSFFIVGKLFSLINYYRLNRKYINNYIRANGLPDYVHVHVPIKAGIIALWLKWKYNVPYLLTEHYGLYNNRVVHSFRKKSFLFRYFTKRIIRGAAVFLPVCNKLALEVGNEAVDRDYRVIYNTVNTNYFYYAPPTSSKFIFLHVSNMVHVKNVLGILRSFEKLQVIKPCTELWLTGPVPDELKKVIIDSEFFGNTIFLKGEIPYGSVAEQMRMAHCVVLFSRSENMPCVLLEAFCSGRPVIATRVGGIPEVVNESNGLLVDSEDEQSLTDAMVAMIDNYEKYNPIVIENLAKASYSYEAIGKQIASIYNNH